MLGTRFTFFSTHASRNFSPRVFFAYLPVVLLIGHTGQQSRRGHHRRCAQQQGLLPFGRHPSSLILLAMASSGGDTAPSRLLRCPCKDADGSCLEHSNLLLANGHPLGGAFRFETSASSKNRKFQSVLVRNLCVPGTKLVGRYDLRRHHYSVEACQYFDGVGKYPSPDRNKRYLTTPVAASTAKAEGFCDAINAEKEAPADKNKRIIGQRYFWPPNHSRHEV